MNDVLQLLETPVAVLDQDGDRILWCNSAFDAWLADGAPSDLLSERVPQFRAKAAQRAFDRQRAHSVELHARDCHGRPRLVELRRRPIELEGESRWIVEGRDLVKAELKQKMLEGHSKIIERNNRTIAKREKALREQTSKMKVIFDNIDDAIFVVDMEGRVGPQRSRRCEAWFAGEPDNVFAWDYLARFDRDAGAWFEITFSAVGSGIVPLELSLAQLPTRMSRDGTYLEAKYSVILDEDDEVAQLLVVVSDITAEVERARSQRHERDALALTRRLFEDKIGIVEFIAESDAMFKSLTRSSLSVDDMLHALHTLKGNCALFGVNAIASRCHDAESLVLESRETVDLEVLKELVLDWETLTDPLRGAIESKQPAIELTSDELERFLERAKQAGLDETVCAIAGAWVYPRVGNTLQLLADNARRIASRLGKNVAVEVDDNQLRLPLRQWRSFWSNLNHVVRNAIDHGIESVEEREAVGKPAQGRVTIETCVEDNAVVVRVGDDGRGIDWQRVANSIVRPGFSPTRDDLVRALFDPGFTTRDEATEISGRGYGLSAARLACLEAGGTVEVETSPNRGTSFVFRFEDADVVRLAAGNASNERLVAEL